MRDRVYFQPFLCKDCPHDIQEREWIYSQCENCLDDSKLSWGNVVCTRVLTEEYFLKFCGEKYNKQGNFFIRFPLCSKRV